MLMRISWRVVLLQTSHAETCTRPFRVVELCRLYFTVYGLDGGIVNKLETASFGQRARAARPSSVMV